MNNPPPPAETSKYLQHFINQARQQVAEAAAESVARRQLRNEIETKKLELELASLSAPTKSIKPARWSIDTYETQIVAWFNRLPPAARAAPRTMDEFINLLEGRTPGLNAHAGDVSRILIRLGWVRQRFWKADGEGRRVWVPPQ